MPSNGCGGSGVISGLYKLLVGKPPEWERCCDQHDLAYEQGGLESVRLWADSLLFKCMLRSGHPVRAGLYWVAVRVFGKSYWNYGETASHEDNNESIRRDIS